MNRTTHIAAAAALALAAQPALAADDFRDLGMPEHRSAAFAGASFRVGFGEQERRTPTARLQLGVTHSYQDRRSAAPASVYRTSGLELGLGERGRPALYVAGAPAAEIERRLGISTGGAIAIGAGIAVAAVLVLVATSSGMEGTLDY